MLKRSTNVFSVDQKLERLRLAVIEEFGFASDTVKTTFHPNQPTNHENTDFIHLHVSPTPESMKDAEYARVQPFAAAELHKFWIGKRPLVTLKMDLPGREPRAPDAPPMQIPT